MSRTAVIADVIRTQARQLKMPGLARSFEDLARQLLTVNYRHTSCSTVPIVLLSVAVGFDGSSETVAAYLSQRSLACIST